jgi:hypothetical protein
MIATEWVQSALTGYAPLVAVVPSARIRAAGPWRAMEPPYIVHRPVADEYIATHQGHASPIARFYQISVFARSISEALEIARLVAGALAAGAAGGAAILGGMRYIPEEQMLERDIEPLVHLAIDATVQVE